MSRHRRLVTKYAERHTRLDDPVSAKFTEMVLAITVHFRTSRDPLVVPFTFYDESLIQRLRLAVRGRIRLRRGEDLVVHLTNVRDERPADVPADPEIAYLVEFSIEPLPR